MVEVKTVAIGRIKIDSDPTMLTLNYIKDGKETTLSVDMVEVTAIRPEKVNEVLCNNASNWTFWAAVTEVLFARVKELKNTKESLYAELSLEIRNKALADMVKTTEGGIADQVKVTPAYSNVVRELEEMEVQANLVSRFKEGLSAQRDNLAVLSSNLRASGDSSLGIAPVISFLPKPSEGTDRKTIKLPPPEPTCELIEPESKDPKPRKPFGRPPQTTKH